ncbi:MAG: CotH kinase family protein [Limnochordia bacterium]
MFSKRSKRAAAVIAGLILWLATFIQVRAGSEQHAEPGIQAVARHVVINEVVSNNGRTLVDEDGEPSDWIELYNPGGVAVHLGGWYLSDDPAKLAKWRFPVDTWIGPGEYLIVWASDKNRGGAELHTNFRIAQEGESLFLVDWDGATVIDQVDVPAMRMNFSYGRKPDAGETWALFERIQVTPGASNNLAAVYIEPDPALNPAFSHTGGFYREAFDLVLEPAAGTVVYYTLDGSVPDPVHNRERTYEYNEPIAIRQEKVPVGRSVTIYAHTTPQPPLTYLVSSHNRWYLPRVEQFKGTVIRVRAYAADGVPSEVITHTYFVDPKGFERHTVPVVAVTCDPYDLFDYTEGIYVPGKGYYENLPWAWHHWGSGNFHGRGDLWERPIYIEFWEPGGVLAFAQNAGVRVHGDASRAYAQKSLRIIAYSDYDIVDRFYHELFPGRTKPFSDEPFDEYKSFILRNGGNTWDFTMLKDGLLANLLHHTKLDHMYFRPAVVYLNGEYWGIHNIRDHLDEWYLHYSYGVDPEHVEMIEDNVFQNEGNMPLDDPTRRSYRLLLSLIDPNYREDGYATVSTLADPEVYEQVKSLIDIDTYLDYAAVQIYIQNHDWPGNNVRLWRLNIPGSDPSAPFGRDGLWRWMIYDLDLAFANYSANTMVNATLTHGTEWHNPAWATYLLRSLLENPEFRIDFINRCADHMNTTFLPEVVIAELDRIEAAMEPEIAEHIRRWGRPAGNLELWKSQNESLRVFARFRPASNMNHIVRYFRLEGTYRLTVKTDAAKGFVKVNSITIAPGTPGVTDPGNWSGTYFKGIPITISAVPHEGHRFVGWEGVPEEMRHLPAITITPKDSLTVTACFTAE